MFLPICLPSKTKPDVCIKNFYLTNAQFKKYINFKHKDLNINNKKWSQLIPKENYITSIIIMFFYKNLSLQEI